MMEVSKSGFYKWKAKPEEKRNPEREKVIALVQKAHNEHRTHGYRWVAAYMRLNCGVTYSDSFVFKAWKYLGLKAETKHGPHKHRAVKKKDPFPNLIFSTWDLVDRPRQVIVSDMTAFCVWWTYYELTFYFDVFTKQILTWHLAGRRGDRLQYTEGLKDILDILGGEHITEPVILHTDQGSVYSSFAYNELIHDSVILRSMSRVGTPGDNPVNESLNGWIKEELFKDLHLNDCKNREEVEQCIKNYVLYYNSRRPSWALGYDTPDNYYKRFIKGEIEHRKTFENRVLSEIPKGRKKGKKPTFKNENKSNEPVESTFENT